MVRHQEGYTLTELVVVMLIFSVVMTVISVSFNRIAVSSGQIVKAAETDIGGLIGLELLRSDLELAGFGLPWSLPAGASYTEAGNGVIVTGCADGCPGADAYLFNDAQSVPPVPRGIVLGNNVGYNHSDYLVLKGTALGMSAAARSWSYLNYSSTGVTIKPNKSEVELKPADDSDKGDWVIVLKTGVHDGVASRELVTDGGSAFSLRFNKFLPAAFWPGSREESHQVFGVAPGDQDPPLPKLAFPFNRADYYLSRPAGISGSCAEHTGVLYKTTLNQNGSLTRYPLLDCVADLQVIFFLDRDGNGEVDDHRPALASDPSPTQEELQKEVKEVRLYILAQQGKKDPGYLYPVSDPNKVIVVGDASLDKSLRETFGSVWTQAALADRFGSDWRHYHWKVYTIVVQPKNL
jgi:prepilin-type N-terminal cleavage/methylation domain-containing protein